MGPIHIKLCLEKFNWGFSLMDDGIGSINRILNIELHLSFFSIFWGYKKEAKTHSSREKPVVLECAQYELSKVFSMVQISNIIFHVK